jgi:hypothetical protein
VTEKKKGKKIKDLDPKSRSKGVKGGAAAAAVKVRNIKATITTYPR